MMGLRDNGIFTLFDVLIELWCLNYCLFSFVTTYDAANLTNWWVILKPGMATNIIELDSLFVINFQQF
jgi:hypothetical protein